MCNSPILYLSAIITLVLSTTGFAKNPPPKPTFPEQALGKKVQGEKALEVLGSKLPEVAAWYGMAPKDFAKLLKTDRTAWLDKTGRLYYIDDKPEPTGEQAEQNTTTPSAAPFPLGETFNLHSKPGAKRVIYLDFDGHITTGTAWNASSGVDPIVSPTYSRDNDHSTFNTSELEDIQNMWRQVSEDYAPFDVNVTTQDPGANAIIRSNLSDEYYGTRVVITDDNFDNCGCGGFAYVGVFSDTGSFYKPAFVFNTSLVGAGEAISHEAGHNLGLSHDGPSYYEGHGSGPTGWAPIMGVGYYQQLVQWSKGEYAGASQKQDDILVMQNNGLPIRSDDHQSSTSNATSMTAQEAAPNTLLSSSGIISTRSDVDTFSFTAGAGSYSFDVIPAPFSPNLDIQVQLLDANGNTIATTNPVDLLTASFAGSLPVAGDYYLTVQGVGKGDPLQTGYTDYGSLGQYSISGLVTQAVNLNAPTAAITLNYTPSFAPLLASFDSVNSSDSDGNIVSYLWHFGDGASSSSAATTHAYQAPGDYQVTLTVTDNDGLTGTDTAQVTVNNQAPNVSISTLNIEGEAPYTVNFSSNAQDPDPSGSIVNYSWNFGDQDNTGATQANPVHVYNQPGQYSASLVVTDNLGATAQSNSLDILVTPPPYIIQHVSQQTTNAGNITGSINLLSADDGQAQQVTERESGGRKRNRYSYLDHSWFINVQSGSLVTLYVNAWMTPSSDSDQMRISYTSPQGSNNNLLTFSGTSDTGLIAIPLPNNTSGNVEINLVDTNRTPGNRSLDTAFVDALYIRTDNQNNISPPAEPSGLLAEATSSSQINLNWVDNADNEESQLVERRIASQSSWNQITSLAQDISHYQDTGLAANTTYEYRIAATNSGGMSAYSNDASAMTEQASEVNLSASGYKVKGLQKVDLNWDNISPIRLFRDNSELTSGGGISGYEYTDHINNKGGGGYTYQVCNQDLSVCSDLIEVIF